MICLTNLNLNKNELQNAVIQQLAVAPANPKLGQIYVDSASTPKRIKWYDGTAWTSVGVLYELESTVGKVLTGLNSEGQCTTCDVKDLQLTGYTPVEGGNVLANPSLEAALKALDQAVIAAQEGGEINQFAFSNIKISNVTVSATGKTDIVEFVAGDDIQLTADPTAKTITISAVVPKNLSEFVNDENFIDNTVSDLVNYYTKTESYTKDEVNTLIGNLATIQIEVIDALPATGKSNIIYLVPKAVTDGAQNVYDEYLWTGIKFEKIGDTSIDLSNYLQKDGDASNTTVAFTAAAERSLPATGDKLGILISKIQKYLSDLKDVAFSGSYNDLSDVPTKVVQYVTSVIPVGNLSVDIPFSGQYIHASIIDAVTGEEVLADMDISTNNATISIAQAHTNVLNVVLMYSKD